MKSHFISVCIAVFLLNSSAAFAADPTERVEVKFADAEHVAPKASISDIAWFEGIWIGTVFGGPVEHRVMPPNNGHMPGLVRLRSGETDEVFLYELSSFSETDGTLTYRNRLFDPALETMGEDESVTDRSLVAIENGVAYFDGITFAPDGPDSAIVAFILTDGEGSQTRHTVHYERRTERPR